MFFQKPMNGYSRKSKLIQFSECFSWNNTKIIKYILDYFINISKNFTAKRRVPRPDWGHFYNYTKGFFAINQTTEGM